MRRSNTLRALAALALLACASAAHATGSVRVEWIKGEYVYGAETVSSSGVSTLSSAAPDFGGAPAKVRITPIAGAVVIAPPATAPVATQANGWRAEVGGDAITLSISAGQKVAIIEATNAPAPALPSGAATESTVAAMSAKLPASLGAKTGANSLSIVPASDATFALVASETHLGEIGGRSATVTVAQTVTAASAYASGNAIGGLITVANVARISGGSGLLQSISVSMKSAQTGQIDVVYFNANPTGSTCTDKVAFSVAAADFDKVLGVAHVTDWTSLGTPSVGQAQNLAMPFALASGTTLYACAVTRSTPTFTSTSDVSVSTRVLQN